MKILNEFDKVVQYFYDENIHRPAAFSRIRWTGHVLVVPDQKTKNHDLDAGRR